MDWTQRAESPILLNVRGGSFGSAESYIGEGDWDGEIKLAEI
jgi:hypothetical protein